MSEPRAIEAAETDPAPSSGRPSAGSMLRQLRESAGVDITLLASAMKVSLQKIEALENEQFDQLPDLTFARGLAAAVCRAFGADPAPVLERMPVAASGLRAPSGQINQPFKRSGDRPAPMLTGSSFSKPLLIAVAGLLIAAGALWLLPTLPIQLGGPASTASAPSEDGQAQESVSPPLAAAPAAPEAPAVAVAPAPVEPAPAPAAPDLLSFTASGETWVTVRDAAGKQLINRALQKDEVVSLNGEPPLSVTIGRKDAVAVTVRGEPFDHRSLSKTTVSRFQVK
ncbi:MAG: DUF4115 domain-containing protein [Burkholderiales bacterium]|nr:DUF4115 domain-containing protein [Burkholderiales bacterium]MBK8665911.1 DUF4115 domain-containing protein [Burkholderiales bacterium]